MLFNETITLGEKFVNSVAITILGMVVVFAVLIIIAYSLELLRIIFGDNNKKKIVKSAEELKIVNTIQNDSDMEEDIELIVLLTAAVATQSNKSVDEIFVRSIKPVLQKSSIWASAGRQEQMLERIW